MKVDIDMVGDKQLYATMQRQKIRVKREAAKVCLKGAQKIMAESLSEVPRDTEALANSAFVEQQTSGDVTFGYGGLNVQRNPKTGETTDEYMVTVHEDLNAYHPVGKAKFLEDPVNRSRTPLLKEFMNKLKRAFGL